MTSNGTESESLSPISVSTRRGSQSLTTLRANVRSSNGYESRRYGPAEGVGGFFDSFIVMIIVTLGIMLVTSALSITNGELSKCNKGKSLDGVCRDLLDQILANDDLFVESGLLDLTMLKAVSSLPLSVEHGVLGYRIILTEVHPNTGPLTLAANGSIPFSLEELHTARVPVNVQHSAADVRAALISVWVW
jgi:hypothetical protein